MFKLCLPGKLTYAERIAAIQEERSKQAETAVKNGLRDMIGRRETPVGADEKRLPYAERIAAIQAERAKQAETAARNGLREPDGLDSRRADKERAKRRAAKRRFSSVLIDPQIQTVAR